MTIDSVRASTPTRSQTVFMVAALMLSVVSFMLNATMLSPAIRDINTHLGPNAFGPISSYFYLAGAIMILGVLVGIALVPLYRQQLEDLQKSAKPAP